MPDSPTIYSLSSITKSIKNLFSKHASNSYWIKAEIVKLNYYSQSGHCYPDLVEKIDGDIVAKMRGNIWNGNFIKINKRFKEVLNQDLGNDMMVVCLAKVNFDPVHGLSLNIIDINPEYTLGELAKQKAATIKQLKAENLFYLNKSKSLAQLPKTIAIISVSTSKGYNDFINIIDNNSWKYKFHYKLFPAILQGAKSVETITTQLNNIKKYIGLFDAVAIIRGGGGDIGLSSYNDYRLAKAVATYPIPVLCGIGHSTNLTVTEMVSYKNFITPTKIAEYLIQSFHNFSVPLKENLQKIENYISNIFEKKYTNLKDTARLFNSLTLNYLNTQSFKLNEFGNLISGRSNHITIEQQNKLKELLNSIRVSSDKFLLSKVTLLNESEKQISIFSKTRLENETNQLRNIDAKIKILSPINILQRGFSITRLNGINIKSINQLSIGDKLTTNLADGQFDSQVDKLK